MHHRPDFDRPLFLFFFEFLQRLFRDAPRLDTLLQFLADLFGPPPERPPVVVADT